MAIKEARRSPKPPAKRAVPVIGGRPIDRLSVADRDRIQANVAGFIAYAMRKKMQRELEQEAHGDAIEHLPA